jgi:hypothetical protein
MEDKRLTAVCEVCRRPVDPIEQGFMYVEYRAIRLHEQAWYQYNESTAARRRAEGPIVLERLSDMPSVSPASWHVLHHECGGDEPANSPWYWFSLDKGFSYPDLLHWTAHLMESKSWLKDTNWDQVIRRAAHTGILTS